MEGQNKQLTRGATVWVWSSYRYGQSNITETKVKSIGKKYITTEYDERIKFDVDSLKEIDGRGCASFLITDIEKYKLDQYYGDLIHKLNKFEWKYLERADLDSVFEIIREYE